MFAVEKDAPGRETPTRRVLLYCKEYEIYHGGELSLALGTPGLDSFYSW
ncbi:MAG TPA: hypothetical protein VGD98_09260 [Ktedonobacteraceae bacterium]